MLLLNLNELSSVYLPAAKQPSSAFSRLFKPVTSIVRHAKAPPWWMVTILTWPVFHPGGGWFYRRSLLTEWLLAKGKKKSLAGNERSRSTDIYTCNCQVLWESFPSLWFAALSHQPTRPRYATRRLDPAADAAKCLCRTGLLNPSVSFTGGCCDEPHLTSHPPSRGLPAGQCIEQTSPRLLFEECAALRAGTL